VIHCIRFGAESPGPDTGMEPAVCVEMAARQLARPIVLAPALAREVSMKKRFRQVPMISALRDTPQPHRRVCVYANPEISQRGWRKAESCGINIFTTTCLGQKGERLPL
jgi:hypothetical protein